MYRSLTRLVAAAAIGSFIGLASPAVYSGFALANDVNGVVSAHSRFEYSETIRRIKEDVEAKGITFFTQIDQAQLGNASGNRVMPSTLLLFGNPALGTTFITANQEAGLDWPVRVLVFQSADGSVHVAYNDFGWIANRHGITNRQDQFAMATMVIRSIVSAVEK